MGCSRETVLTCALSKLQANFDLPMSKADASYKAMVDEFVEHLRPFDAWELQEGMFEFIHKSKSRKWPAVGAVVAACSERSKSALPPDQRGRKALPTPDKAVRQPPSQEERERNAWRMQVLAEAGARHRQGEPFPMTLEDCKAEARRRQESQTSRLSQTS